MYRSRDFPIEDEDDSRGEADSDTAHRRRRRSRGVKRLTVELSSSGDRCRDGDETAGIAPRRSRGTEVDDDVVGDGTGRISHRTVGRRAYSDLPNVARC